MIPINYIFNILVILPQITQYYDIWLKFVIRHLRINGKHAVRFKGKFRGKGNEIIEIF